MRASRAAWFLWVLKSMPLTVAAMPAKLTFEHNFCEATDKMAPHVIKNVQKPFNP